MVIVLGATGFIGMYLVETLKQNGYEVLATGRNKTILDYYDKQGIKTMNVSIQNAEDFNKLPHNDVEGVVLLAGLLPANAKIDIGQDENAVDYIKVNAIGTINVLEYCRKNNIKKIISTTTYADVRNAWEKDVAITEEEPRDFKFTGDHAVYVISKNASCDLIEYYSQQHGLQGSYFRLPPVYGVGPHSEIYVNGHYYKTGIQTFIENAKSGEDIEIWGDPSISRDIVYVKDVASAFVLALKSCKAKGLYNMTSGVPVTLEEQVKVVIDLFSSEGKKSKIVYRPERPNNTPSFLFSMDKAKRDLGFIPAYRTFRDMMLDYKKELESNRFQVLVDSRRKGK